MIKAFEIDTSKLFWYPFGMCLAFVPELTDYGIFYFLGVRVKALEYAHFILGHSLGFINALIYGYMRKL